MHAFVDSGWFIIPLVGALMIIFVLPVLIALCRRVDDIWLIVLFNVVGGLTCVGWPAALLFACIYPRRRSASRRG